MISTSDSQSSVISTIVSISQIHLKNPRNSNSNFSLPRLKWFNSFRRIVMRLKVFKTRPTSHSMVAGGRSFDAGLHGGAASLLERRCLPSKPTGEERGTMALRSVASGVAWIDRTTELGCSRRRAERRARRKQRERKGEGEKKEKEGRKIRPWVDTDRWISSIQRLM